MSDTTKEDELAGTEQPFVAHLVELRDRLIKATIAIAIAVAADRLPIGGLPLPLILLGILLLAVLIGLRHRPVPARWLLIGGLAAALAELARYRYLGVVPIAPASLSRICFGFALAAFGLTASRAR